MRESTILTKSGGGIDLLDPSARDVHIEDIAFSLARIIRFGGHSPGWTVAQHSIEVAQRCEPGCALEGLLHDAAEAYVGDIIRPVKMLLGKSFQDIERRFELAIAERFNLTYPWPTAVKTADMELCRLEISNFWPSASEQDEQPYLLHPLSALCSEKSFLDVFQNLSARSR